MLYHHQQQVLLFKEEVMKQQKLKLCCLRTKQNGRSSYLINLEMMEEVAGVDWKWRFWLYFVQKQVSQQGWQLCEMYIMWKKVAEWKES